MTINKILSGITLSVGCLFLASCAGNSTATTSSTQNPEANQTNSGSQGASNSSASTSVTQNQPQIDFDSNAVVYFDFDKSSINPQEVSKLENQLQWLQQNSNVAVTIEGHTDYLGTSQYNLALGERRASSVKSYLISKGLSASRVRVVSYGKERPVNNAETAEARAENRRAVTVK